MATNASMFAKSMELIVEFLNDKGFCNIASNLAEAVGK